MPDRVQPLLLQRKKARDQKLFLRFLALSPKAQDYYRELEIPKVIGWLRFHRITRLDQVTQQQLRSAHEYYRPKQEDTSWVAAALD